MIGFRSDIYFSTALYVLSVVMLPPLSSKLLRLPYSLPSLPLALPLLITLLNLLIHFLEVSFLIVAFILLVITFFEWLYSHFTCFSHPYCVKPLPCICLVNLRLNYILHQLFLSCLKYSPLYSVPNLYNKDESTGKEKLLV